MFYPHGYNGTRLNIKCLPAGRVSLALCHLKEKKLRPRIKPPCCAQKQAHPNSNLRTQVKLTSYAPDLWRKKNAQSIFVCPVWASTLPTSPLSGKKNAAPGSETNKPEFNFGGLYPADKSHLVKLVTFLTPHDHQRGGDMFLQTLAPMNWNSSKASRIFYT